MIRAFPTFAALLLACSVPLRAAEFSVGPGADCTHATVQAALDAAASTPADGTTHRIKLPQGEIQVANLTVAAPAADIHIDGGYATCSAGQPAGTTTLRRDTAAGQARLLTLGNPTASDVPVRFITLSRLTLTGGASADVLGGGAIFASGKLTLVLETHVRIVDNEARNGGGIYLLSVPGEARTRLALLGGPGPDERPVLENNRATGGAANGHGGAIYATGGAEILLYGGRLAGNQARRNGGAIAAVDARIEFHNSTTLPVEFIGNTAGTIGPQANTGQGGALFAERTWVLQLEEAVPVVQLLFNGNRANAGGAVYARGANDSRTPLYFRSTHWVGNEALDKGGALYLRDGIELSISHDQEGGFCLGGIALFRCSRMDGNIARNQLTPGTPGGAAIYADAGAPPPHGAVVNIGRTLVEDHLDDGGGAIFHTGPGTLMLLGNSILRNNTATGPQSVLIHSGSEFGLDAAFSTILANQTERLFRAEAGSIDLHGSIIWDPGKTLAFLDGDAGIIHDGCLLSHTTDQLPAPTQVITLPPRLDGRLRPRGGSPALDVCDATGTVVDLDYRARGYDVPGVTALHGNADLGALEQVDIVFYGGFGQRPSN